MGLLARMARLDALPAAALALAGDTPSEVRALLGAVARAYLRAGGIWTPEAFAGLEAAERDAAVAAGDEHRVELACMIGRAARGDLGEAQVRAVEDDGDALEECVARRMLARYRASDVQREQQAAKIREIREAVRVGVR